jgi:hypothetical protein
MEKPDKAQEFLPHVLSLILSRIGKPHISKFSNVLYRWQPFIISAIFVFVRKASG